MNIPTQYQAVSYIPALDFHVCKFGDTSVQAKRDLIALLDTDYYDIQHNKIVMYYADGGVNPNITNWKKVNHG